MIFVEKIITTISAKFKTDNSSMKILNSFFYFIFLLELFSCDSTKNITGTYQSNFAEAGFISTKIILNKDSTFGYLKQGDMMYDTAFGFYQIKSQHLVLNFEKPKFDTSLYSIYGKDAVNFYNMTWNEYKHNPEQYLIRRNKLRECDSIGRIVRWSFGSFKRRKYLLFGRHDHKKRYFLKKIN
jgi:hypothetical protein